MLLVCVCSMATIFIEIKAILWQEVVPRFLLLWHIYIIRTLYAIEGRILLLNMVLSLFLLCNAVFYACIYLYISMQVAYLHDFLTAIYSHNGYSKFKRISITHSRVMVMPNLIFGLRTAHAEHETKTASIYLSHAHIVHLLNSKLLTNSLRLDCSPVHTEALTVINMVSLCRCSWSQRARKPCDSSKSYESSE